MDDRTTLLFGLGEFIVVDVDRVESDAVRVVVETVVREAACPECGTVSARVKDRPLLSRQARAGHRCGRGADACPAGPVGGSARVRRRPGGPRGRGPTPPRRRAARQRPRLSYSVGFALPNNTSELLALVEESVWSPAYKADGAVREGAWVAEPPAHPHWVPGGDAGHRRQGTPPPGGAEGNTDADGLGVTPFATNTTRGQLLP